jgi:hypothetical protein
LLVEGKDSYIEGFLVLLPHTYVLLSKLILFELTFSLVPSSLRLLTSVTLKFLS